MRDIKFDIYNATGNHPPLPTKGMEIRMFIYQLKGIMDERMLARVDNKEVMVIWDQRNK